MLAVRSIWFRDTIFFPVFAFRRPILSDPVPKEAEYEAVDDHLPGILCPICRWRPLRSSRWTCWDCDHPEYFYSSCGTDWNTFETRGLCPTCSHQWIWTSCLSCWRWSRHEDWYVPPDDTTFDR